jgi:hypothetical protein
VARSPGPKLEFDLNDPVLSREWKTSRVRLTLEGQPQWITGQTHVEVYFKAGQLEFVTLEVSRAEGPS